MKMQKVESSMIKAIGFLEEVKELHVMFNNGSIYRYTEVPADLFSRLVEAESKGKFINKEVKGVFDFEKVG